MYWLNRSVEGDAHFERALSLRDRLTDRERLIIEADIANWRRHTDVAVSLYQRVLVQYPDDLPARAKLGYTLLRAGRCGEALEPYEWLRKHDSTTFSVRVNLATCYSALHRYPESLREYSAALTIRPTLIRTGSNVVQEYAQTLIRAGRTAAAESVFTRQLQGDIEARSRAHRSLALLRMYSGQSAAARDLFRQAISEDSSAAFAPSFLRDEMFLIRAFSDVGQLDSARRRYRDALEFARHQRFDSFWLESLATLGMFLGEKSGARELETRTLAALRKGNGDDDLALHLLEGARAFVDGNLSSARQHYDLAVTVRRVPPSLFGAARVARAQERPADAEKLFAEVIASPLILNESLADLFDAHLALGQLAARRGDTASARQHLGWIMTQWAAGDTDLVVRREAARALAALNGKTP